MGQGQLEEIVGWVIIGILCNGAMLAPLYLMIVYLIAKKGGGA